MSAMAIAIETDATARLIEGYLVEHGGKTITVFSAPNYCDTMGNKGAFIHFDATLEPAYTQYDCVPHPAVKPMAYAAGMGGLFA